MTTHNNRCVGVLLSALPRNLRVVFWTARVTLNGWLLRRPPRRLPSSRRYPDTMIDAMGNVSKVKEEKKVLTRKGRKDKLRCRKGALAAALPVGDSDFDDE